jgi:hypothetical protein
MYTEFLKASLISMTAQPCKFALRLRMDVRRLPRYGEFPRNSW